MTNFYSLPKVQLSFRLALLISMPCFTLIFSSRKPPPLPPDPRFPFAVFSFSFLPLFGVTTGLRPLIRKHPLSHFFRSSPPAKLVKFLPLCPWELVKKIQPSSWIVLLDQPEGEGESST
ncbi:hypothetical protein Gotur_016000 [Gossypium turneri]